MDHLQSEMANLHLSTPTSGGSYRLQPLSAKYETPHKQNMSSTNVFMNGSLEQQKKAVQEDLGPIPEVSVDFMLDHIIPNSNVDVEATLRKLNKVDILTDNDFWSAFDGKSPHEISKTRTLDTSNTTNLDKEARIFKNLKDIYDSIISCAQFHDRGRKKPTLMFEQNPNRAPVSDTNIRTRPDGFGVLDKNQVIHTESVRTKSQLDDDRDYNPRSQKSGSNKTKAVQWFDIACVEEYKIQNTAKDRNDNVVKIIWSLHHIMNVDHRRRFTFGITVENEDTRIWFACRQIVIVTQLFNFNKNPPQLVRLIASLAFATPTQLGYDPTMTLQWHREKKEYCYDIECTSKGPDGSDRFRVYRTQEVLSDLAFNLRGRASRVYAVRLIRRDQSKVTNSARLVLKDSWVDTNRIKEGDLLETLLSNGSSEDRRRFLHFYQHGVVRIDDQDDSTEDLIMKGQKIEIPDEKWLALKNSSFASERREYESTVLAGSEKAGLFQLSISVSETASNSTSATKRGKSGQGKAPNSRSLRTAGGGLKHNTYKEFKKPIVYSPKVHYRVVFLQYGKSFEDLLNDGQANNQIVHQVMRDITQALKYLAKMGCVHRDVSTRNIFWNLKDGLAKLFEFECAKIYGTGASSFVREGTYAFMPGEVMKGKYSVTDYATQNAKIPFIYNPIHDLESLWWIGVYCLLCHYPAPYDTITHSLPFGRSKTFKTHREFNKEERRLVFDLMPQGMHLFPSIYDPATCDLRMEEIHDETTKFENRLQGEYLVSVQELHSCLNDIRRCISWAYRKIQSELPRTEVTYFTDVLRIADPTSMTPTGNQTTSEGSVETSVYDRVLQILETLGQRANRTGMDVIWPLASTEEERATWIASAESRSRLRPRKQPHGIVNMDSDGIYHD